MSRFGRVGTGNNISFSQYQLPRTMTLHDLALAFLNSNHNTKIRVGYISRVVGCIGLPAVSSEEVDHIYRGQTSIQMLHVHQDSKGKAACNVLALLYKQNGPQQDACIAALPLRDTVKALILTEL